MNRSPEDELADDADIKHLTPQPYRRRYRPGGSPQNDNEPTVARPTIMIRVGETERIVNEIEAALIASDRGLYRRGGFIVAIGFDRMQTWDGKTVEVQIIEERDNYALLEDIEAAAEFAVFDARTKTPKRTAPPVRFALTLKQRRHRLRLENLVALVRPASNCASSAFRRSSPPAARRS